MNFDAFIFDFDGVLADSVEVKTRAFAKLFESYGENIVKKVVEHHRMNGGMTRYDKFRAYYKDFLGKPLSDKKMTQLANEFSNLVVDEVVAADEIAGASQFLKQMSQKIPCFVNSATPNNEIVEIVKRRGWDSYFKEVLGAPTSKKDNLADLLARYQLVAERCLFFGDATSDYKAAMACGVPFFGIAKNQAAPLLTYAPNINWATDFYGMMRWL